MYESFYGLRERPFNLCPDPRFLFLSKQHTEALTHLQYGLTGRPGLTVLVGEAGTGKTTLLREALDPLSSPMEASRIVHLSNPTLTRAEFYEYLAVGFGFSAEAGNSKPRFLYELEATLIEPRSGGIVALVVDEAQSLPHELLEEVRLLTNLQTVAGQALTVVLVGQPELADRLNEGRLRQLKQRVALRCELAPLDAQDTQAYIARRVAVGGGRAEGLFTQAAVAMIHERSGGIPRTISVICDNALVNGFAANVKPIGIDVIREVCRDFHIGVAETPAPHVPRPSSPGPRPGIFETGEDEHAGAADGEVNPSDSRGMFAGYSRKKRFLTF